MSRSTLLVISSALMVTGLVVLGLVPKAAAQAIAEFAVTTSAGAPQEITAGSDGAMWFTEPGANKIGRITTTLTPTVTEFPLATVGSGPFGIVAGPDGNLWFTENAAGKIGTITTLGSTSEFPLPGSNSGPLSITVGSDGNLWFTEQNAGRIGKISTAGALVEFNLPNASSMPQGIRPGADGALWFTESGTNKIGRITTDGLISEYPNPDAAARPSYLAPFTKGGFIFTETGTDQIALIDQSGAFQGEVSFPTPGSGAGYIAIGPDGGLWFTEHSANKIARLIATAGTFVFREFTVPTALSNPTTVSAGPDGNLWFTEKDANKIGRLTPPASTTPLVAAVLPASRSVQSGHLATAFATIINAGTATLNNCGISTLSPVGAALNFQTTNPATNAVSGVQNVGATIAAGGAQSYFFSLLPGATQVPTNILLGFACDGVDPAQPVVGVNSLLLAASAVATPDVVALALTPSNDGIVNINGTSGTAAFAVATVNVGAAGLVTAFLDTGTATVNASITICETNPSTGACVLGADTAHVTYGPIVLDANETSTFSVFVTATGAIPFSPATNRIFVRFKGNMDNVTRGSTSVAVRTQ